MDGFLEERYIEGRVQRGILLLVWIDAELTVNFGPWSLYSLKYLLGKLVAEQTLEELAQEFRLLDDVECLMEYVQASTDRQRRLTLEDAQGLHNCWEVGIVE